MYVELCLLIISCQEHPSLCESYHILSGRMRKLYHYNRQGHYLQEKMRFVNKLGFEENLHQIHSRMQNFLEVIDYLI